MFEDFMNKYIGIRMTINDADKLVQLESTIGLKWSSGNQLASVVTLQYLKTYPEIWLYVAPDKDRLYYAHGNNSWRAHVKEIVTVDEFLSGFNQCEIEENEFDLLFKGE